jgi:hypothetical protein
VARSEGAKGPEQHLPNAVAAAFAPELNSQDNIWQFMRVLQYVEESLDEIAFAVESKEQSHKAAASYGWP